MNNNNTFFFYLSVLANLCQLYDLNLNLNQTSNDEIMSDLQKQDKLMQDEIVGKLNIIVEQNKKILELLEKE